MPNYCDTNLGRKLFKSALIHHTPSSMDSLLNTIQHILSYPTGVSKMNTVSQEAKDVLSRIHKTDDHHTFRAQLFQASYDLLDRNQLDFSKVYKPRRYHGVHREFTGLIRTRTSKTSFNRMVRALNQHGGLSDDLAEFMLNISNKY